MRLIFDPMHEFLHLFLDVLRNSVLITGLVIIMMLMIEYVNIHSHGKWFTRLRQNRFGQVVLGAGLGIIPGCMGGFAAVSMYSHKLLSFGALIAMMIASSGDEAFVMLAMIPKEALILMGILFAIAILAGWLVDKLSKAHNKAQHEGCEDGYQIHDEDHHNETHRPEKSSFRNMRHASAERIALLLGVILFIVALAFGMLEHEHEETVHTQLNIFDEYWMNLVFAVVSLFVVWFIATAPEHVVKEHLWEHIIRKHFLSIFLWTFGALFVIQVGLHYLHIDELLQQNHYIYPIMILLAVLVGIIPESGPHMIFVTLFASGTIPFSVLLASSISQDGHASLPLLAESKRSFVKAKIVNAIVAALFGYLCYLIGF